MPRGVVATLDPTPAQDVSCAVMRERRASPTTGLSHLVTYHPGPA